MEPVYVDTVYVLLTDPSGREKIEQFVKLQTIVPAGYNQVRPAIVRMECVPLKIGSVTLLRRYSQTHPVYRWTNVKERIVFAQEIYVKKGKEEIRHKQR